MASKNFGKQFEQRLYEDLKRTFPTGLVWRLNDQMSGYRTVSQNPGDYALYNKGLLYFIEAKSIQTPSFPLINLRQFDAMNNISDIKGVNTLVVMWFVNKDKVLAVPIKTIRKMKEDGLKSLNPDIIDRDKYYFLDVPSIKLRTFMKSDYKCLDELLENEEIENYGE